jgi:hypothetical protein
MKNKFIMFFLLIAIIMVIVLGIVVFMSLKSSAGSPDQEMMRVIDLLGIENDLCSAPAFGANQGFAVNPYQPGNQDQDNAAVIGASVSYILREVKYFTLFIVVLTVLALNACSIIIYFILDNVFKPTVMKEVKS